MSHAALFAALVLGALVATSLAGCLGDARFTVIIRNETNERITAHLALTYRDNATEFFNRTYDVGAKESVRMNEYRWIHANVSTLFWTDSGLWSRDDRTPTCGSCAVSFTVTEQGVRRGNSVAD